jgi:hypothetical protein
MSRRPRNRGPHLAQEPRSRWGALSGYPPKPTASAIIADSCTASAIASTNTVIDARLALPARTRYNTSGRERPLLWPVLPCPPMAGFEVSTEAVRLSTMARSRRYRRLSPGHQPVRERRANPQRDRTSAGRLVQHRWRLHRELADGQDPTAVLCGLRPEAHCALEDRRRPAARRS